MPLHQFQRILGMENISVAGKNCQEKFQLPAGFRFHPTDEELITNYLSVKVRDSSFTAIAIAEADLNKCEPWDLPWRAKLGENEWYFFSVRDRKYPTGHRTNRATEAGYWKATGKDREICRGRTQIGMKKTLVFYMGRAPRGEKTNWVMHEYRLEGKLSNSNPPTPAQNDWVLCRVFQKPGGKKVQIAGGAASYELPPLMDASSNQTEFGELSNVTCFSNPNQTVDQKTQDDIVDSLETPFLSSSVCSNLTGSYQPTPLKEPQIGDTVFPDNFLGQEQIMTKMLTDNNGSSANPVCGGRDFDADIYSVIYYNNNSNGTVQNQEFSSASAEPVDIGSLWKYSRF